MSDTFTPRAVVVVALASLVVGFVTVFGGGMLAMRSAPPPVDPVVGPAREPAPEDVPDDAGAAVGDDDGGSGAAGDDDGGGVTQAAGVTLSPMVMSRCFAGMAPVPIAGEHCGRLPALEQHFAAHAGQIAACAQGGRGRLAFVMDIRFSNQHVGAWGGPASTISNAGPVSLCVRRATAPLPLAGMVHSHDRYIVTLPIAWE